MVQKNAVEGLSLIKGEAGGLAMQKASLLHSCLPCGLSLPIRINLPTSKAPGPNTKYAPGLSCRMPQYATNPIHISVISHVIIKSLQMQTNTSPCHALVTATTQDRLPPSPFSPTCTKTPPFPLSAPATEALLPPATASSTYSSPCPASTAGACTIRQRSTRLLQGP